MPGERPRTQSSAEGERRGVHTRNRWRTMRIAATVIIVAAVTGWGLVYFGAYNLAADVPHTRPVRWLLETARDRSVAMRARDVRVPPNLEDATRIVAGAGLYNEMCANCHLAPGMEKTEISQGLYPPAPEFNGPSDLAPSEAFWIIKHGLKMTGMAAWGVTHSDTLIWDMVAFLQKLPALSPDQYNALVQSAPKDHDEMMKAQDPGR